MKQQVLKTKFLGMQQALVIELKLEKMIVVKTKLNWVRVHYYPRLRDYAERN